MTLDRDALRWNGWGRKQESMGLSESQLAAIIDTLGERFGKRPLKSHPAARLEDVILPQTRIEKAALDALEQALGSGAVFTSERERAYHAAGKSLRDVLRLRTGRLEIAPDVVVYPRRAEDVQRVLAIAEQHALAVVPFGGGTSVVGGVEPLLPEGKRAVLSLDTTHMDGLLELDEESSTATFMAGIDGPALEGALSERGYTLGHFPQSFEFSTLGGWIAARSSGQQSDGYGGIDELVVSAKLISPSGELHTLRVPRHAAGPDLKHAIIGSEGMLGVIVESTVRVTKIPEHREFAGVMFRDFASGVAAIRALRRTKLPITMARLSDAEETRLALLLRKDPERTLDPTALLLSGLKPFGFADQRSVLLFGIEGDDGMLVSTQMLKAQATFMKHGGLPLGKSPGRHFLEDRFRTPYLRDVLLDQGVAIDTMETSFEWRDLLRGHERVVEALRDAAIAYAGGGVAMGHVSHSYGDGACVYFIVVYPLDAHDALGQWTNIKKVATDAIVAAGGTVSHHHGVGMDHAPWLKHENGPLGMTALGALKNALDPQGIMNPGKVL